MKMPECWCARPHRCPQSFNSDFITFWDVTTSHQGITHLYQITHMYQILGPYIKRFSHERAERHRQTGKILYPRPLMREGKNLNIPNNDFDNFCNFCVLTRHVHLIFCY